MRLNTSAIATLKVGQSISLATGDSHIEYTITETIHYTNGDVSHIAHTSAAGQQGSLVFTQGKTASFARVTSPEGAYVMRALSDQGVLLKESSLSPKARPPLLAGPLGQLYKGLMNTEQFHKAAAAVQGQQLNTSSSNTPSSLLTDANASTLITLNVLAVYDNTQSLDSDTMQTRINHLFTVANQVLANSLVYFRLQPVGYLVAELPNGDTGTTVNRITQMHTTNDFKLRETAYQLGADLIAGFILGGEGGRPCGTANSAVISESQGGLLKVFDQMHTASDVSCEDITLIHEIGHNLGLAHQRNALGGGHTFPYAVGHGVPDEFVTIMAYEGNFNSSLRIPVFSNPYLWCGDYRCGVFREDANNSADAAYALNAVRFQAQNVYANHQNQMTFANALTGVADSAVKTCLQQAQQTHKYYYAGEVQRLGCGESIASLAGIHAFSELRSLALEVDTPASLAELAQLPRLNLLSVGILDGKDLSPLFSLREQLHELTLYSTGNYCWQIFYLNTWPSLEHPLGLAGCDSTDDFLDFDGDGKTNQAELLAGTDPSLNPAQGNSLFEFRYTEHAAFEEEGELTLSITRGEGLNGGASVRLRSQAGTAVANSDFVALDQVLTFAAYEREKQVTVTLLPKATLDGDKHFSLVLANANGGTLGTKTTANITVYDSENRSRITPVDSPLRWEGLSNTYLDHTGPIQLKVIRSWMAAQIPLSITLEILDGSAKEGENFTVPIKTLEFSAQDTEKSVVVNLLGTGGQPMSFSLRMINGNPSDTSVISGVTGVFFKNDIAPTEPTIPEPPTPEPPAPEPETPEPETPTPTPPVTPPNQPVTEGKSGGGNTGLGLGFLLIIAALWRRISNRPGKGPHTTTQSGILPC